MDLNKIKSRLDRLNNPGGGKSSDFKANFWKAPVGEKSQIRLVPYKHNKDFPFSELYFYFGIGKPRMIALTNFEESDPIMEFATQLRKTGEKDNMDLAKKLYPKLRIFAPVVVRGEEDKGVRFWEFGKMVYQELLGVMSDEDYGDITDPLEGTDISLTYTPRTSPPQPPARATAASARARDGAATTATTRVVFCRRTVAAGRGAAAETARSRARCRTKVSATCFGWRACSARSAARRRSARRRRPFRRP